MPINVLKIEKPIQSKNNCPYFIDKAYHNPRRTSLLCHFLCLCSNKLCWEVVNIKGPVSIKVEVW